MFQTPREAWNVKFPDRSNQIFDFQEGAHHPFGLEQKNTLSSTLKREMVWKWLISKESDSISV